MLTEYDVIERTLRLLGPVMHAPPENDVKKVERLLNGLQGHPDKIAAFLHGQGMTGTRGCPESCVLANFFRRSGLRVSISPSSWSLIDPWEPHAMPRHVGKFLYRFDLGEYQELEAE